jgi:threonine dehydrogenase-like Zn-dependent dehydrogenase
MTNPRLVCIAAGEIAWQDAPLPGLQPGQVRIKNLFGTEKHGTMASFHKGVANSRGRWDAEKLMHHPGEGVLWGYPIPLGNMQLGVVAESTGSLKEGDHVYYHGFFQPEAVIGEDEARPLAPGRTWKDAFVMDPSEFALGALRDGGFRPGDTAAVFGLGAIGLMTVQMLARFGASHVTAVDPVASRRELALKMGADQAIDPIGTDTGALLKEVPGILDMAIDFSGSLPAFQAALRGIGYHGTIVMGAFPAPFPPGLDLGGEAHMNRPRVIFTRACSDPNPDHPRWSHARIQKTVEGMIAGGSLSGEHLFAEPSPFAALLADYPRIAEAPGDLVKLAVKY